LAAEFYEVGKFYVEVNAQSSLVTAISPGGDLQRSGTSQPLDFTPRYTPAQLELVARAFIARCAGANLDALTPYHSRSPTTTESITFFFRWEDRSRHLDMGVPPLIQVGFTRGGDLLNYNNWLDLARLATPVIPRPTSAGVRPSVTRAVAATPATLPAPKPP